MATPSGALVGGTEVLDAATRARYAEAIVRTCLDVRPDDQIVVMCEPVHRELALALAEAGYRAGARHVDAWYTDSLVRRVRIEHAAEENLGPLPRWDAERLKGCVGPDTSLIAIRGPEVPDIYSGLPAARVGEDFRLSALNRRSFNRAQADQRVRFCVVAWPTVGWARTVYPELGDADAVQRLMEDLLSFCRLAPDDPDDAWPRHVATLVERARLLNERPLRGLELRGPGTDLSLGLAPGTRFLTAAERNAYGQTPCVNYPTEEVFSSPDARRTEGAFRCSLPLSLDGRRIEGIAGAFRRGRLVRLEATRDEDRDVLAAYLDGDRGARRLGEVALVERESRIGQAGRVYEDTLLDENAAAHIAFGFGFKLAREDPHAPNGGVNASSIHLDVMIGSDEMSITAIEEGGARVPVIVDGAWALR
jgi:aminopeptidase